MLPDKNFYKEIPFIVESYIAKLKRESDFEYSPALKGVTNSGKKINLGFSNYALKIRYMLNNLNSEESLLENWAEYLNSYQSKNINFPANSYIDNEFLRSFKYLGINEEAKFFTKSVLNVTINKNFASKSSVLFNAINAETKQTVSSLYQIGKKNKEPLKDLYQSFEEVEKYLNSLDWSKPWSAGAQYASICLFSVTQNYNFEDQLYRYLEKLIDIKSGSYFSHEPLDSREVINGAMKVISGLDWLNKEIHKPEKLIDFCLQNVPYLEGCDIVDFVYVLYKCSKQTEYKKSEIINLLVECLKSIKELFVSEDGGFSYFVNKSQTHYYGLKITNGLKAADLHGTLLCLWAILMILDCLEILENKFRIIKP